MNTQLSKWTQLRRFLSDRHAYRDQSHPSAELLVFVLIAMTASWTVIPLAAALGTMR